MADKFFGKMKPGMMGNGFVGLNQDGRKGKPQKRLFANMDDILEG